MSVSKNKDAKLMYQPFSSILNPGFWQELTNIKINQLRLSKEPVNITGSYSCCLSETLPCFASFDYSSFGKISELRDRSTCPLHGQLVCTNIKQEFLDINKKEFLNLHGNDIWNTICDGRALAEPEKHLSRFAILVFADLKKYKFYYWFAFPAINYPNDVCLAVENPPSKLDVEELQPGSHQQILSVFSEEALQQVQNAYDKPSFERNFARGYFIVKHYKESDSEKDAISLYPLTEYRTATIYVDGQRDVTIYFAYTDPSASPIYPGWPLRNYLCLIATQFCLTEVNIIRIRKGPPTSKSKLEMHHSRVMKVSYSLDCSYDRSSPDRRTPPITGWEKNESHQVAPKRVDLSNLLDPRRLAEDAVNLNLRLMKWRLIPDLDLDKIADTKCLILGCGTLGCHVARGLLAWGVKRLTLVDNGKISYSNPVRQSLYDFNDCTKPGGAYKAKAAEAALKRIHPLVQVESHVLSIPMPGHHISDQIMDQTKKDVDVLVSLIHEHDVVFLLMDTRESRWLPTVIAKSEQKLVINAAIGFDTFLLQRFGVQAPCSIKQDTNQESVQSTSTAITHGDSRDKRVKSFVPGNRLGCYFCNDIVAPGDSTQDRTLDQQCTVSRPGVSMMVSALAVEFLASIVSSRLGSATPAPMDVRSDTVFYEEDYGGELGIVPHSIRGNISTFQIYMPTTPAFLKCAGCSDAVINAYQTSGYEFLLKVFEDPSYLEELAGLKDLQNVNDNVWALDSDDDDIA